MLLFILNVMHCIADGFNHFPSTPESHDMPGSSAEQKIINDEISSIRSLVYGLDPSPTKDLIAAERLRTLVDQDVPCALTLQALFIWHGYGFEQRPEQACQLAEKAAEMGDSEALVVLASMHFDGYGCERNFEKSLALLERFDNEATSIPFISIGEVGLNYYDFRTSFVRNLNGRMVAGSMDVLEELNRWLLDSKRRCIAWQAEKIRRNPMAFGGIGYRSLPCNGAIGGEDTFLKGQEVITHIGFHNEWLNETFWVSTSRLAEWPAGISFHDVREFNDLSHEELVEIGKAYLAHKHEGKEFVLRIFNSSVHRTSTLLCGDQEVMSVEESG